MYSLKSYQLTEQEYNYLLPVLRKKLICSNNRFYFIGSFDELADMLSRLKGLFVNYPEHLESMVVYNCFKANKIDSFREKFKS